MSLTRIVPWSQQLVCEVLEPGDLAVDLTAGKGRDTLALVKAVAPKGQVIAFDTQDIALQQTASFLTANSVTDIRRVDELPVPRTPGVDLVLSCHSHLADIVPAPVKGIIANLGYLPGGDQALITQPESTLAALKQSLELLVPGGRLAVTVYPAHPGGAEEASQVDEFFNELPREHWQVLLVKTANRTEAPYLYVAESLRQS